MIDFHTHTLLSDGVLCVAEHVRRAIVNGYTVVGITDHVDFSNIDFVYESLFKFYTAMKDAELAIKFIPGIEITHVTPKKIDKIVAKARALKIPLIIVHGESPVEPVEKGTNRAAIDACVDILAHPGLINADDVKLAVCNGVNLEISCRHGHSFSNGYVTCLAREHNAGLVVNSDGHASSDFLKPEFKKTIMLGAGLKNDELDNVEKNIVNLYNKILSRLEVIN